MPKRLTEDRDTTAAGLILLRQENATQNRMDLEYREKLRRHSNPGHRLRVAGAGQVVAGVTVDCHAFEHVALFLPVQIVRGRNDKPGHSRETLRRWYVPNLHQTFRILKRKRPQQYRIHNAEDGSVRSDAEREHKDGDHREPRCLPQHAVAEANVLKQRFHISSLVPQCHHRIHLRRAACRNVASQQRNQNKHQGDHRKCQRISRTQSKQQRAQCAC